MPMSMPLGISVHGDHAIITQCMTLRWHGSRELAGQWWVQSCHETPSCQLIFKHFAQFINLFTASVKAQFASSVTAFTYRTPFCFFCWIHPELKWTVCSLTDENGKFIPYLPPSSSSLIFLPHLPCYRLSLSLRAIQLMTLSTMDVPPGQTCRTW